MGAIPRRKWRDYPPYKHKVLDNRTSLMASVNARKNAFNNLVTSSALYEDESLIIEKIIDELDYLREKIKENNGKDKTQESVFRFGRTGSHFTSF